MHTAPRKKGDVEPKLSACQGCTVGAGVARSGITTQAVLAWWSNSVNQRKHVRLSSCKWECAKKSQSDSAKGGCIAVLCFPFLCCMDPRSRSMHDGGGGCQRLDALCAVHFQKVPGTHRNTHNREGPAVVLQIHWAGIKPLLVESRAPSSPVP